MAMALGLVVITENYGVSVNPILEEVVKDLLDRAAYN